MEASQQLLGPRPSRDLAYGKALPVNGTKMVSKEHELSMRRQCALLTLSRSNLYYEPKGESAENLRFMEIIDKQFLETPWYGSRQPLGTFAAQIP